MLLGTYRDSDIKTVWTISGGVKTHTQSVKTDTEEYRMS